MTRLQAQTLTEYGLIVALLVLVVIATLTFFGKQIEGIFNKISKGI